MFVAQTNLLPDTLKYCYGDSAHLEVPNSGYADAYIVWTTPQGIVTNTNRVPAVRPGYYTVKVTYPQSAKPLRDSTFVKAYGKPRSFLRDTILCRGKKLTLDAGNAGMNYLWNTFETTQRITIDKPGRFWSVITNGSCILIDTVMVKLAGSTGASLPAEAVFCVHEPNKVINVKVNPGARILWSTGATVPSIYALKEGYYKVQTSFGNCEAQTDSIRVKFKPCECEMMIPNSFTPNEDNRNDYFFPVLQCDYSYFIITISDRWGNVVYSSNNPLGKWDGRFKGNLCPEDIYIYKIESTEKLTDKKQVRNGHISLFR